MKIDALIIENFLTIGRAQLSLADKGLVLIQGINREDSSASSNGSGKSSIADALCWALYGETAREESGDEVVNNTAKKDCMVQVRLLDGEISYTITRHRKHKIHKNATFVTAQDAAGHVTEMHKGTEKETQLVIDEIMGCNHEVFVASIYAGQEAMPDLPKMTDKQLKSLIEQAAGIERLEKAYEIAKREMQTAILAQGEAAASLSQIDSKIIAQRSNYLTVKASADAFEAARPEKVQAARTALETTRQSLIAAEARVTPPATVAQLRDAREKLATAVQSANTLAEAARQAQGRESTAKAEVSRLRQLLDGHIKEAERLSIETPTTPNPEWLAKPCGSCGKPHTLEEFAEWRVHAEETRVLDLAQRRTKVTEYTEALRVATVAAEQATAATQEAISKLPDTTASMQRINQIDAKLNEFAELDRNIATLKASIQAGEKAVTDLEAAVNPHNGNLAAIGDGIRALAADRTKAVEAVAAAEVELELRREVAEVFGPAGVRAHILDTVTPFLNERTSEYLAGLSDGNISAVWSTLASTAKGELREKFNIEVDNALGAGRFKGLSGGEKRKVRLGTVLALQDLVGTRATKPIDLWIGDEIDDAMDPAGLERLMTILEKKARERGTVLIISHNELTDWCDQSVTVTKEGGYSKVEGVLCA